MHLKLTCSFGSSSQKKSPFIKKNKNYKNLSNSTNSLSLKKIVQYGLQLKLFPIHEHNLRLIIQLIISKIRYGPARLTPGKYC